MVHKSIAVAVACLSAMAILCEPGQALQSSGDRPAIVSTIEQDFHGFFLLTTNGDGRYDVFQQVVDRIGLPDDANIICMTRGECFFELLSLSKMFISEFSSPASDIGKVRRRFAAIRDSYRALRTTPPGARSSAAAAWREAIKQLSTCVDASATC
jgi:hypothetical protein